MNKQTHFSSIKYSTDNDFIETVIGEQLVVVCPIGVPLSCEFRVHNSNEYDFYLNGEQFSLGLAAASENLLLNRLIRTKCNVIRFDAIKSNGLINIINYYDTDSSGASYSEDMEKAEMLFTSIFHVLRPKVVDLVKIKDLLKSHVIVTRFSKTEPTGIYLCHNHKTLQAKVKRRIASRAHVRTECGTDAVYSAPLTFEASDSVVLLDECEQTKGILGRDMLETLNG
ncbi:hypothetical protein [Shewanella sp. MBTL60-007]|uniref:hypothetical protein n=1 Tax=Shewanella sp. MBTL60-007 TaxID=2815911 RepID=UPI001BBDC2A8|nr:hypothetical protein [Shewanella sp. MBTL60-007]GIU20783.1 hypothetical protein TUM3792_20770 [Shewanella sp. MBTL60-007]